MQPFVSTPAQAPAEPLRMPAWASEVAALYESNAANQFVLYGNVGDRLLLPLSGGPALGSLDEFLQRVLLAQFDVIFTYDLGNGIRLEKGGEIAEKWSGFRERAEWPKPPRQAIDILTHFFRYCANLARLGQRSVRVASIMRAAHLVAPSVPGSWNYDLNALALLLRHWSSEELLATSSLVTFLLTDALNDLHPLLANNPRSTTIEVPVPSAEELETALRHLGARFPTALRQFAADPAAVGRQLAGSTLSSVESLLKRREHGKKEILPDDLVRLKKTLVEKDAGELIEFIESRRTLDDVHSQDRLKEWLRQDIALWDKGDSEALPMGYLICGPVGTGKTYLVECLAGEAGIPVVKLKNFRDKWIGSTEGNLEKIFRLLQALGRCFVFVDEADQALGRRDSGANDSGLSGRVYSMFAKEMSNSANRGRIIWVLATSRPDLVEVDLKRPGRVDVKIPIFPTTTAEEGFQLLAALCKRKGVILENDGSLASLIPNLLTPGAAEALSVKIYRSVRTKNLSALESARESLVHYQAPVSREVMNFQITLAVNEATDIEFVPPSLRHLRS
jgi:hypothetical protein